MRELDPAVTVRLWAGAKAAAGQSEVTVAGGSADEILGELQTRFGREFGRIADKSSLLVDGVVLHDRSKPLSGVQLEILPPFAGG